MKKAEVIFMLGLLALGIYCATGIQEPAYSLQKDYLGISGYPRFVGWVFAAVCAACAGKILLGRVSSAGSGPLLSVLPITVAVAYVGGIVSLGFCVSTFAYLTVMPSLFDSVGNRRIRPVHAL